MKTKNIEYQPINFIVLMLFCGYVVIWYLQIGSRIPDLGTMRFEFFYALLLTCIVLVGGGTFEFESPLRKYVILYFIVLMIQIPFSHAPEVSWYVFVNRIIKFFFLAFFIISFIRGPTQLKYFLAAFLFVCFKMGQEGFYGQLSGSLVWENQGVMRLHGPTPLYAHPNSFAGMALGALPFVIYLFPLVNKYIKGFLAIQFVFSINIIIFTGSRTGYVALIGMALFMFFQIEKKMKFFFILILLFFIGYFYIPVQYQERLTSIVTGEDKEGQSTNKRIEILKDSVAIFFKHPLGVGVSAFPTVRNKYYNRRQDTHNLYLQVATNLGIQGLIIFLLLIYNMLKVLKHLKNNFSYQMYKTKLYLKDHNQVLNIEHRKHLKDLMLFQAVCKAVVLFIVIRLVLGLFGMDLYEIYWWFALGLTVVLYNINKIAELKTERLNNA